MSGAFCLIGWHLRAATLLAVGATVAGCASQVPAPADSTAPRVATVASPATRVVTVHEGLAPTIPGASGDVVGRNDRILVYRPAVGDTLEGVSTRFLGDPQKSWILDEANPAASLREGQPLLVPLRPLRPLGVTTGGLQTVPILCYHRLGQGSSKMVIAPNTFEQQMNWLVRNGYRVIRLGELAAFLAGEQALPPRAVVITFDDGYESVYRHAFPVLRRLGLPATAFVYTDFLGGGDALTWPQMQEMLDSGLVDIQSHSKSHRNLTERRAGESDERYRANIDLEMRAPRELLERRLPSLKVRHLAYPYGDANDTVLDSASRNGIELAATVVPGGNPFYAHPLMLRRTMIFGDMSLEAFKARLVVQRELAAP
jgi:peptidoglycan/xylan/chitin deacetylase (PgdA/CDA1 family)